MVTAVNQVNRLAFSAPLPDRVPRSEFVAGRLSLAFCNTVALPKAADRLRSPESFAAWAERAGYPLETVPDGAAFAGFVTLRDHLQAIFAELANGLSPPQDALDAVGRLLVPARLVWSDRANRAVPQAAGDKLQQMRQAIVADAIDLLTGNAQIRIKRCPALDCRWFFFDLSRNVARRWCAMADCGVRDKVQRYRDRAPAF
jgi:predicted RNA-binding Zn ribbon-like protein